MDECYYTDEVETILDKNTTKRILVLEGVNTDSGASAKPADVPGAGDKYHVDKETLFGPLVECRVIKSEREIDLLRHVCRVSSDAHEEVMRRVRPGMTEFQIEALFRYV